jgi:hypothetical protein
MLECLVAIWHSAAPTPTSGFKVEMRVMRGVVIRTQHHAEEVAAARFQVTQKSPIGTMAPVIGNADIAPITQSKTDDVDRLCPCMAAECRVRLGIDVAAGIATDMRDRRNGLPEHFTRKRLQRVSIEKYQRGGQRTGDDGWLLQTRHAGAFQPYRVGPTASVMAGIVVRGCELRTGLFQRGETSHSIHLQAMQFISEEQIWGRSQIQGRPGVVAIREMAALQPTQRDDCNDGK